MLLNLINKKIFAGEENDSIAFGQKHFIERHLFKAFKAQNHLNKCIWPKVTWPKDIIQKTNLPKDI